MSFVNKYVKRTEPYPIVSHEAWEDKSNDVLKMDWNEATIPPSPKVNKALIEAINTGKLNWYPDTCNQKLIGTISDYADVDKGNVEYFASSDVIHEIIARTFIEAGDLITIVGPTYDNFRATVEGAGGLTNFFYLNESFELDSEKFNAFLSVYEPKLVYLCNPNNPTGTLHSLEVLEDIISNNQNSLFLIDEAYFEFSGISAVKLAVKFDNVIVTRTLSKAFGLASVRFGYLITSYNNISYIRRVRNPKNVPMLTQVAAEAAFSDIEYMNEYVDEVKLAKQYFIEEMNKINKSNKFVLFNSYGNFLMIKFDQSLKNDVLAELKKNKIYVRSYSHVVGMEDFIRFTIGKREQMERVFNEIKRVLISHQGN
ncbi:pyridoxal phosphate-dependent aminotransferase [Vibrio splendidus]|jgi:histidinol-phosphate aminotransferase|uniref:pyridoxal phosphate-dependent aminotransferase n=3 Tax=Vibrio splendidus TaxID=29497 RepID=UPI000305E6A3|nr:histidinol-phosphate transaminase [Vibrio splendidus]MCC4786895.1 histidinol-phosphate aminotransferase family protein [Vibrio splendidus]MCC4863566.1 histidinol-phosphate aminotransferase family protein [Vibrio splendidus]MDP2591102.1 histidinol-phosphate transaminase [Vibrio splendidus]OEE56334.1 aminotransferase [Vibrio splendidus FF-500]PTO78727.1 histidinol-phosphate aminotransferase family protein [Vibrio splendidus]